MNNHITIKKLVSYFRVQDYIKLYKIIHIER